jgi:hypothetical protein
MKYLLLITAFVMSLGAIAQKEEKKKKVDEKMKIFYKDVTMETSDYKIYVSDAVSTFGYAKFKLKVFNKTNDYLFFNANELLLLAEGKSLPGSAKSLTGGDKPLVIAPNDEDWKIIEFKGSAMQLEKYSIELKGVSKASANGKLIEAPIFEVPASKNDFVAGPVSCTLKDSKVKTDQSSLKFECTYSGDNILILDPYKSAAIMANGKENANTKKYKGVLLEKGKSEDFFVVFNEILDAGDMQKKGFKIKWNDAFKESKLTPVPTAKFDMAIDQALTDLKNK